MSNQPIICDVYNGETLVGTLTRLPNGDISTLFDYAPDFRGPALSLSLPKNKGPLKSEGLHPFFCNMISEGWLEEAQTRVLEARKNGFSHVVPTRFDILAYFGRDCIGTIHILPRQSLSTDTISGLKDMASKLAQTNNALVPGVQPKILAKRNADGTFSVSTRKNRSTHIAKLQHTNPELRDIVNNEFVTMEIFRALLPEDKTAKVELAPIADGVKGESLLVERFDRTAEGVAIECYDFNQLLDKDTEAKYDGSYKQIADYIRSHAENDLKDGIKTNTQDIDILFKRLLGTILVENGDAHLKNFSLLRNGNEFRLSPNYDVVSCARYRDYSSMALAIGHTKSVFIPDIKPKHVVALAKDLGIMSANPTQEEINKVSLMVDELGAQVKSIRAVLRGDDNDQHPGLQKIAKTPYLDQELKKIFQSVEKRWNGSLATTTFYMHKKIAVSHAAPLHTSEQSAAAPAAMSKALG